MKKAKLFINGDWCDPVSSDEVLTIRNPATGETVGEVASAGKEDVQKAIDGASEALEGWARLTAKKRSELLYKWYQLILDHQEELAHCITKEMGKPYKEAQGEVVYAAGFVEWYAEEGKRVYGETIPAGDQDKRILVLKQPVGVVAAITPWNFPAAMITRKIAPALAAGCTVVIKPSSDTPLTAVRLMELAQEAGFPRGVIQLTPGSASAFSETCMKDERVRKVTFTGSTEVGKILMEQGSEQLKKLSLELGGHAPLIVFDDADLDKAVAGVVGSKFRNAGQTCVCANRVYVQEGIYEPFIERFAQEVQKLKVGNGEEEGVDIGPLINEDAYEKVDQHVQDAVKHGATVVCGGSGSTSSGTYFYEPTILKNVSQSMIIMNEETFGPVAPIQSFKTQEEAVELANHSPYGLAAYFFTENLARGMRVAEGLEYGIVGWNDGLPAAAQAPFGGWKESGIGREGGRQGIEAFLETKYVSIHL
ncbi:NAD-dependent succinate-semialdehyde dehydrogenase [Bacillus horti]|uniref:Aldehyde dehydrogenase n=1 Tax=Caldalkalibacillus horti TaxID=77523 RepID=A0ABT9VZJ0_9BACI|nr:NAD-dependent succinate-semialdehyde dehydrogenase [Bacillus horti]MDQ0166416.1 succinate-semialdehyde dehydrogenase/glutarate-semialdehyde dehydrogenase [Bacillus horti]